MPFSIEGKIDADSGVAALVCIDEDFFNSSMNIFKEVPVQNGSFVIHDSVPHPLMCRLFLKRDGKIRYISGTFFVDNGSNSITFETKDNWGIPKVSNRSTAEFHNSLENEFHTIDSDIKNIKSTQDSLETRYKDSVPDNLLQSLIVKRKELVDKKLRLLKAYVQDHQKSYVGLWQLIQISPQGYSPVMDTIFRQFADSISSSYLGTALKKRLQGLKITAIGNKFPSFDVTDKSNRKVNTDYLTGNATYTLVDFWFSHCSACISQFPGLKKLYEKYRNEGFNVIGISTDPKEKIPDWLKVIKEEGIGWEQYLDESAKNASELMIYAYPTNFLLKNGIIIRKDISMDDLEKIVRERNTQK